MRRGRQSGVSSCMQLGVWRMAGRWVEPGRLPRMVKPTSTDQAHIHSMPSTHQR